MKDVVKRFLEKKVSFISLIILTVVYAGILIYMLVRPVAIGSSYEGVKRVNDSTVVELEYEFISSYVVEIDVEQRVNGRESLDLQERFYYYIDDGEITVTRFTPRDMDVRDFKKIVDELDDDSDNDISAFSLEADARFTEGARMTLRCEDSVEFAIASAVVEVILVIVTGLSGFYFLKKKKA